MPASFGKMPATPAFAGAGAGPRFDFLVQAFQRVRAPLKTRSGSPSAADSRGIAAVLIGALSGLRLGPVRGRESHAGEHVVLAVVHRRGEPGPARSQLIGDMPPGVMRRLGIGPREGLPDRGGDHGVPALRHMRERLAHPVRPASLPGRAEHTGDRVTQTLMRVRDHQLDAPQPAPDQALDKARPALRQAREVRLPAGQSPGRRSRAGRRSRRRRRLWRQPKQCGHPRAPSGRACPGAGRGGVEPQIPPLALDRPLQESGDPLIDIPGPRRGRLLQSLETPARAGAGSGSSRCH